MKTLHIGGVVGGVCLMALLSPLVIGAAERAVTVNSLEKAYAARLAYYDTEIASTTKAVDAMVIPEYTRKNVAEVEKLNQRKIDLRHSLVTLGVDRHTTEVAYELLVEGLR